MRPKTPATAFVASNHTPARSAAALRGSSRRSFLGGTVATTCAAAGTLPTGLCFAASEQRLRVGLVGCGGRGTGAALQALEADPSVRVVALGDVFADQVASAADVLGRAGGRFDCPPSQRFVGPDAYRRVIDSGVDVAICTDNPGIHNVRLTQEYESLISEDVISFEQLEECQRNAFKHAFAWNHDSPPADIIKKFTS